MMPLALAVNCILWGTVRVTDCLPNLQENHWAKGASPQVIRTRDNQNDKKLVYQIWLQCCWQCNHRVREDIFRAIHQ